jgi:hypothetical protein
MQQRKGLPLNARVENVLGDQTTAFDHDVVGIWGWPWIKEFRKIQVSLKQGFISFEK